LGGSHSNCFSGLCTNNVFGRKFASNIAGTDFNGNTIGDNSDSNQFGEKFENNSTGASFSKNFTENECNGCIFGDRFLSNSLDSFITACNFGSNIQYSKFSGDLGFLLVKGGSGSHYIKTVQILQGTKGNPMNILNINFEQDRESLQVACISSEGNLKFFNPADLA
jgi:hypothetical protein